MDFVSQYKGQVDLALEKFFTAKMRGKNGIENEDFHQYSHCNYFKHSNEASKKIFNFFSGGYDLFPFDLITEKAREIQLGTKKIRNQSAFSWNAFEKVLNRYHERFNQFREYYIDGLMNNSVILVAENPYLFTSAELQLLKEDWENGGKENFYGKIDFRITY